MPMLADRGAARRVIEILIWIGSPDALQGVKNAMLASPDYETLVRVTAYMMMSGGPEGRAVMLAIDPARLDDKARKYYQKTRGDIQKISYDVLSGEFAEFQGDSKLSDAELKKHLAAMYENYGKDNNTNPMAVLNSGLPRQYLSGELARIRARMLYRLSNEALDDVKITNALLNALYYRPN